MCLSEREGHPSPGQQPGNQGRRDEGNVAGGGLQRGLVSLGLLQPLGLGASVLEPDLDLGVRQLETLRKLRPLGDGQVTLLDVFLLQLGELLICEGCPGFPVRLVFPQRALERQLGHGGGQLGGLLHPLQEEGRHVGEQGAGPRQQQ